MIIYRYLFVEYLKVLVLCVISFIAILLTTRLEEIARFAASGGSGWTILKFASLQIPYVLPIVLPVSSLISAIVLSLRLSHTQELTTLRASGLSLKRILSPILITAAFIALVNFYIVSEVATESILGTRQMQREIAMINPLMLTQNKQLTRHRDFYIDTENRAIAQSSLEGIIVAIWNNPIKRINLVTAKEIAFDEPNIHAKEMTMFSSFKPNKKDNFDNLYIENIRDSFMDVEGFSLYLKQKAAKVNDDYLKMSLLLSQIEILKEAASSETLSLPESEDIKLKIRKSYTEIVRRASMGMSIFTLTLLGASFGISTGRQKSFRNAYYVVGLSSILLVCIFAAKAFMQNTAIAMSLYFAPHAIILWLSTWNLKRITRGIE